MLRYFERSDHVQKFVDMFLTCLFTYLQLFVCRPWYKSNTSQDSLEIQHGHFQRGTSAVWLPSCWSAEQTLYGVPPRQQVSIFHTTAICTCLPCRHPPRLALPPQLQPARLPPWEDSYNYTVCLNACMSYCVCGAHLAQIQTAVYIRKNDNNGNLWGTLNLKIHFIARKIHYSGA